MYCRVDFDVLVCFIAVAFVWIPCDDQSLTTATSSNVNLLFIFGVLSLKIAKRFVQQLDVCLAVEWWQRVDLCASHAHRHARLGAQALLAQILRHQRASTVSVKGTTCKLGSSAHTMRLKSTGKRLPTKYLEIFTTASTSAQSSEGAEVPRTHFSGRILVSVKTTQRFNNGSRFLVCNQIQDNHYGPLNRNLLMGIR